MIWTVAIDGVTDTLTVADVSLDRRLQTSFPETVRNPVGAVIGGGNVTVERDGGWSPWQVDDVKGAAITIDQTVQGVTRRVMTGTVQNVVGRATSNAVTLEVADNAAPLVGLPTVVPARAGGMHSQWVAWWCLMQAGLQPLWFDPAWTDMAPLCGTRSAFIGYPGTPSTAPVFDVAPWGLSLADGDAAVSWPSSHPMVRTADVWRVWVTVDPAGPSSGTGAVRLLLFDDGGPSEVPTVQVGSDSEDDITVTAFIGSTSGPVPNTTEVAPSGGSPVTVVAEWRESGGGEYEVRWTVQQDAVEIAAEDWQEPATNEDWDPTRTGWEASNVLQPWAVGGAGVAGYDGAAQPLPTVVHPGGSLRRFGESLTLSDPGNLPEGAWAILGAAATASRSALWTDGAGLVQALGADDIASADPTVELTESNAGPIPWATSLDDLATEVSIPGQALHAAGGSTVFDEAVELSGETHQTVDVSWSDPVRQPLLTLPSEGADVFADSDLSGGQIGSVTVTQMSTGSTSARLEVRNLAGVEGFFGWEVSGQSWRVQPMDVTDTTGAPDGHGRFSPSGVAPFVQSTSVARDLFFALAPELEDPEPQVGPWEVALPSLWGLDVGDCVSFRDALFSGAIASRALVVGWRVNTDGQPLLELRVLRPTLGAHDELQAGNTLGDHDTELAGFTLGDHDDDPLHLFGAF